ncbi:hypothetical protein PoB_006251200 [Plakobranchus ocellatus]|uniref:Uncharacterized protein n=1 Tax=Plakobranchus ocellatus TaxID=259542 RepID=A0AAV4CVR9_9GAST|nr:hypothetical protein PoB_006251200 [Plakobranchus ocellatus]
MFWVTDAIHLGIFLSSTLTPGKSVSEGKPLYFLIFQPNQQTQELGKLFTRLIPDRMNNNCQRTTNTVDSQDVVQPPSEDSPAATSAPKEPSAPAKENTPPVTTAQKVTPPPAEETLKALENRDEMPQGEFCHIFHTMFMFP